MRKILALASIPGANEHDELQTDVELEGDEPGFTESEDPLNREMKYASIARQRRRGR